MRTASPKAAAALPPAPAPFLPPPVRDHLARLLRDTYGDPLALAPAPGLGDALTRLEEVLGALGAGLDEEMRRGLALAAPGLRAFAMNLARNEARADDLVQETLLRAWKHHGRFEPGSNLQAWLATILRNLHVSEMRKARREVEDVDGGFAGTLSVEPPQAGWAAARDLQTAMSRLTPEQRDAILLVTVKDVPYHKAAAILGCPVGTLKTRVCRARDRLAEMLGHEGRTAVMVRHPRPSLAGT